MAKYRLAKIYFLTDRVHLGPQDLLWDDFYGWFTAVANDGSTVKISSDHILERPEYFERIEDGSRENVEAVEITLAELTRRAGLKGKKLKIIVDENDD